MERQKPFHSLTEDQKKEKLKKDSEYEIAVENLSTAFYIQKRKGKVTAQEIEDYKVAKSQLWNDYLTWAKGYGLYETITPEQQLTEAERVLDAQVEEVNLLRKEMGVTEIKVQEAG
jgi:hypothetical protein